MRIAFAMAVGPGESEMALDNIHAIRTLYPDATIWLRDDATQDGTWETLVSAVGTDANTVLTRNAHPKGYHWLGQTCAQLLERIAPSKPDLLIKIDPDTVLIRPGLADLFQERFAAYGNGICGSYRINPLGVPRDYSYHARMMMLDLLPIGPQRDAPFRWRPVGYFRHILKALLNGYKLGENVLGGLYAIDGATLQKLATSGFLRAIGHGQRGMVWSEDVLISLGVKAVGARISPMNESLTDAPTHILAVRPLQISQERLRSPVLLAVHPVKRDDVDLRSALGRLRENA